MKTRSSFFPPADGVSHPLRRRWLGSSRYWLFQAGGWGVFWLVLTLGSFTSGSSESAVAHEVAAQTALTLLLVVNSHLMRVAILFLRRNPRPFGILLPELAAVVAASAVATTGPWLHLSSVSTDSADAPAMPEFLKAVGVFALGIALLLAVWVGLYAGYHYYIRYQQAVVERLRLDAAVKDAELRALRAQVNPHFLFNSLNTLRALIPRDQARPREAITLLADLLRASLTMSQQCTITLAEELETVNNYLALEQMRFEERLRVRMTVSSAARTRLLPPFVLQTLIENAVKFGVAPFEDGGDIDITAAVEDGALCIAIRNRGTLRAGTAGTGVGLDNARSRLEKLCDPGSKITLTQDGACVTARLVIPSGLDPIPAQS